jgi:hypothetical protein
MQQETQANGNLTRQRTLGSLVSSLGALVPIAAALVGIVIWLNSQFYSLHVDQEKLARSLHSEQEKIMASLRDVIWCLSALEANKDFRCPSFAAPSPSPL